MLQLVSLFHGFFPTGLSWEKLFRQFFKDFKGAPRSRLLMVRFFVTESA
ncbi:hypothetical protein [Crocosphaera chwakensis]|nr:hypothetical protein [Crocosphaera chwakensis]